MTLAASHNSTYANRLMIPGMNSIVIGPYVIDAQNNVRTIEPLLSVRIGGMAEHLQFPDTMVYMLSMDGPLYEVDLVSLKVTQLFDLVQALNIPANQGEQPHFKAAHTMAGQLYVATNTFEEADYLGNQHGGRLAMWNGSMTSPWVILAETAFHEVTGRHNFGRVVFAVGGDEASVILKVIDNGDSSMPSYNTAVQTYRLPRSTHTHDHLWTTEWPRIREVESERYLMDAYGGWFELTPFTYGGALWGVRPISTHLRMVPDFAPYRGFLVLGGNQVSSIFDANWVTGQSQSGLWFGKTDDLFQLGPVQGWGGPWLRTNVSASEASDPYLMTGYGGKTLHLRVDPGNTPPGTSTITFAIQVDFTGSAGNYQTYNFIEPWSTITTIPVNVTNGSGYAYYVFPQGFSAHWVRFVVDTACTATAFLHYT